MLMNTSDDSAVDGENALPQTPSSLPHSADDTWAMAPSTKLHPPKPPSEPLLRPELLARIHQWRRHRLSVIVAPAGYGKTTLASSALPTTPSRAAEPPDAPTGEACWLALDEDDDAPTRFVQSLAASVAALIPKTAHAATLLALSRAESRRALLLLLAALEELTAPVLLVLDNYHRIQNPAVHDLLRAALEYTPETVHWLILSRQQLPISIGRLRLERQVLELNTDDLRLNRAEIQAFLQLNDVHTTDAEALALIEARTQGWLAGLQLALLSFPSTSDPTEGKGNRAHNLHTLLERLRGDKRLLAEYLAGEVLVQLNEPLRSFLLRCAILERLHPSLCTAVTGMEESEHLLRQAVDQQVFLRALDDSGEWYEQHHLFRELLLHHLRIKESRATIQSLYRRAADWYVTRGDLVAGLRALLAGGFSPLAAELVQSRAQAALLSNHLAELQQWFDLLPVDEIEARPRLLLDLTWLSFLRGVDYAATISRASALFAALPPLPKPWQDELTTLTFLLRLTEGPRQNLHHDALAAIQSYDASSHLARGWALFTASLLMDQAPDKDVGAYTQAIDAAFDAAGFVRGRIYTLARQTHMDLLTAQVNNALHNNALVRSLAMRQDRPDPSDGMFVDFVVGEALYWQNRLPEAIVYLRRAWDEAVTYQDSSFLLQVQAAIKLYNRATGEAGLVLDPDSQTHHWQQANELNPLHSRAALVLWELRYGLACRAPQAGWRAFDALGITLESLPTDAPDMMWFALLTAYVSRGRQLEQLTPGFELMLRRARAISSPYYLIQLNVLRARQQHQLGRHNAARGVMRQLLHEVAATGYVRMILDQPDLIPILRLAGNDHANWLLTQMAKPAQSPATTNLSPREEALLALLADGLGAEQIAERLVLTRSTTRSYLSRLYAKIGVKNHTQAMAWSRLHGRR